MKGGVYRMLTMERMELMEKTDFPLMNYGNNLLLTAI